MHRTTHPKPAHLAGLVDAGYYLRRYPDVAAAAAEPIAHFVDRGWREERDPNYFFDHAFYRREHGAALGGEAPVAHYLRTGERHGLRPGLYFDPAWYRANTPSPVKGPALAHYLRTRHRSAIPPSPELYGARLALEGCLTAHGDPHEAYVELSARLGWFVPPAQVVIGRSGVFDENHYLLTNPDVAAAGAEPLVHFCSNGWKEGRNPNPYFDVLWYLARAPASDLADVNPLAHYLIEGERAGRRPILFFEPAWYRAKYGVSKGANCLAHFLAHRSEQKVSPNHLFDPVFFARNYPELVRKGRDLFAIFLVQNLRVELDPCEAFCSATYRAQSMTQSERSYVPLLHALSKDDCQL
jgi:hypothetical protein